MRRNPRARHPGAASQSCESQRGRSLLRHKRRGDTSAIGAVESDLVVAMAVIVITGETVKPWGEKNVASASRRASLATRASRTITAWFRWRAAKSPSAGETPHTVTSNA